MRTNEAVPRNLLITGAYGVLGTGITDAALADSGRRVITAARRAPPSHHFAGHQAPLSLSVDLLDGNATRAALAGIDGKIDLAFAAYVDGGSMEKSINANIAILQNTLEALSARDVPVGNVVLMGGAKSYGFHLGSMKTPAREGDPRLAAPIFYHQQEDLLAEWAERHGATWTVLRPHMVFGPSIASPMNLVTGLATFAAICRELGAPLRFPGSWGTWSALHQTMDAQLSGRASLWALDAEGARNQVFNITNGDSFRWRHMWGVISEVYGMETGEPQPMNLATQMESMKPVWERLVDKYELVHTPYEQIANWGFLDACLNWEEDIVLSTIKLTQAGFTEVIDTHDSLRRQLLRLREMKLVP
ncbi:SDR family oxidoreductase [Cupriavidus sp. D39]|uniref:SDR family oxidoreductase n=1 Tax=Cupriavidus sp. D39 TaxID=2997877 RepID=UPI00226E95E5|nr:SDR family oxidoreductase [Cupriavidus sp. D39]MCY0854962.1 SDR family oxidoreductase [Cupriavidus sp. D39]